MTESYRIKQARLESAHGDHAGFEYLTDAHLSEDGLQGAIMAREDPRAESLLTDLITKLGGERVLVRKKGRTEDELRSFKTTPSCYGCCDCVKEPNRL